MEIKTVTLARVHVSDKGKDGKAFVAKNGNSYKRVGILVDSKEDTEFRDIWLSYNAYRADDPILGWQAGMRVQIVIEKNGQWTNFKVPTGMDMLTIRVEELELKVKALMSRPMSEKEFENHIKAETGEEPPTPEDDLPWNE